MIYLFKTIEFFWGGTLETEIWRVFNLFDFQARFPNQFQSKQFKLTISPRFRPHFFSRQTTRHLISIYPEKIASNKTDETFQISMNTSDII